MLTLSDINTHILKCLEPENVSVVTSEPFKSGSGCDVLDCEFVASNTSINRGVLKVYNKDFDVYYQRGLS